MRDSGGIVRGRDIASSKRSPSKNSAVGGASRSKHMYGIAMDIHGKSNTWIRQNGSRYGWVANDYPGSHGGHFEFKGAGLNPSGTAAPKNGDELRLDSASGGSPVADSLMPLPAFEGNLSTWLYGAAGAMNAPSQESVTPTINNTSTSGNQYHVPSFSSRDLNNPTSIAIKSIYNLID
jgi:hypothetical protein